MPVSAACKLCCSYHAVCIHTGHQASFPPRGIETSRKFVEFCTSRFTFDVHGGEILSSAVGKLASVDSKPVHPQFAHKMIKHGECFV